MSELPYIKRGKDLKFTDYKGPFTSSESIWEKYPRGGQYGWFCFVTTTGSFMYWDRYLREWKISKENLESILDLNEEDISNLKDGYIITWDNTKEKFVVKSGNVWNRLLGNLNDAFSQVTKFLNQVDEIPTDESDSGIYYVHKDENDIEFRALYIVLGKKAIKIFSNNDYYTKERVESMLEDERYYVDAQMQRLEENMANLGIRKTYSSYVAMQADVNSPVGDNGETIRAGELVMVVNQDDSSQDGLYRYKIVDSVKSWDYASGIGIVGELNELRDSKADKDKVVAKTEVDLPALQTLNISDSDDYALAIADLKGCIGAYLTKDARFWVHKIIESVDRGSLKGDLKELIDNLDNQRGFEIIEDSEYALAVMDAQKRVAAYLNNNAEFWAYKIINSVDLDSLKGDLKEWIEEIDKQRSFKITDNEEFALAVTDEKERIAFGIKWDGSVFMPKLNFDEIQNQIDDLKNNQPAYSNTPTVYVPEPMGLINVYLPDITLGAIPSTKDRSVRSNIEIDFCGFKWKGLADVSMQGSSSTSWRPLGKINLRLELLNLDGTSVKIKIGKKVPLESFDIKADFIDATRSRNNCGNIIWEEIFVQSRPWNKRRPWIVEFEPNDTSLQNRLECEALGHVFGYNCITYMKDGFYGTGNLNCKKERRNYNQEKDNPTHIRLENVPFYNDRPTVLYTDAGDMEISNPKTVTPETETCINDWFDWAHNVTAEQLRTEHEARIFKQDWIDNLIFNKLLFNYDFPKNQQVCSWDGIKFTALPYDLDSIYLLYAFGTKLLNVNGSEGIDNHAFYKKVKVAFWDEIKARYAQIRKSYTVDYVYNTFANRIALYGLENFKREFEKYPLTPSNRPSDITATQGVWAGGCYSGLTQVADAAEQLINKCDTYFEYN